MKHNCRALSLLGLVLMVVPLVSLYFRGALWPSPAIVVVVQIAAALLMLWARVTFGRRSFHAGANPTAGGLVTNGPYAFVRHPIYTAVLLFTWVSVSAHLSLPNVALGLLLTAGAVLRALCEERLLIETYPEYHAYAQRVKRFVPKIV